MLNASAQLKRTGKKGFIVYIGAGDPDLEATRDLALAFDRAGVDILELGVPFSDPLADGLVNQLAAQRGLESGTNPPKVLETVVAVRKDSEIPIVLYIYFNLIHKVGMEKFIADAARAGVDGLLVLDLPPEESDNYEALMKKSGLCHIYLVAPTTPEDRMELDRKARQRIHLLHFARRRHGNAKHGRIQSRLTSCQKYCAHTDLPVAVGFWRFKSWNRPDSFAHHADASRRRQRGGESDCRAWKVQAIGQARRVNLSKALADAVKTSLIPANDDKHSSNAAHDCGLSNCRVATHGR